MRAARSRLGGGVLSAWVACLAAGCALDAEMATGRAPGASDGIPGYELTYAECTDGVDTDDDGRVDCVDPDCHRWAHCGRLDGKGDTASCAYLRVAATPVSEPVDLVWAIDSSGSMIDIAPVAQRELGVISTALLASGVDFRFVLMTAPWLEAVPEPLRSDPRYTFVPEQINQNDAFEKLLGRAADYRGALRVGARAVVVVASDDDSAMGAATFRARYEREVVGQPFTFHAIASEPATHGPGGLLPGCAGPYGAAWGVGDEYYALARATGGETFSICTENWRAVMAGISAATAEAVVEPCSFRLPSPPPGQRFVPGEVNVLRYLREDAPVALPRASTFAQCSEGGAWYFDDNDAPAVVHLCPEACAEERDASTAGLDITLGCETSAIVL